MDDSKGLNARVVPGRRLYPAYRGKEPYAFVSYAHIDSERVLAEIKRFNEAGFRIWYDEGIAPGSEWSDEIAEALSNCSVFVVMLTPASAPRENVLNEIDYALNEQKPFLAIHLEETTLPPGLRLRISRKQAILKYDMTDAEYEDKCTEAFIRFGLKRDAAEKPGAPAEDICEDSPEDAVKRAKGDLVRIDGFDIEHGFLRGYFGKDKDITVPSAAKVIGGRAFDRCRSFIESVDLNRAGMMIAGPFGVFFDCPVLKTVKIPATVKEVTPNMFRHCPNLTVYVRKSQVSADFEERFTGKGIVYLDEDSAE